jgi:DNA-binding transcriptional regulator/RsmH inhibitor MraZ
MDEARAQALALATDNLKSRLESMNEFREALQDQTRFYITRDVHDKMLEVIERRLNGLENFSANIQGKIWMFVTVAGILATLIATMISVVPHLFGK